MCRYNNTGNASSSLVRLLWCCVSADRRRTGYTLLMTILDATRPQDLSLDGDYAGLRGSHKVVRIRYRKAVIYDCSCEPYRERGAKRFKICLLFCREHSTDQAFRFRQTSASSPRGFHLSDCLIAANYNRIRRRTYLWMEYYTHTHTRLL